MNGPYITLRLNTYSEQGWAVVSRRTGAIASDASGALLMRLSREEAERIASALTAGETVRRPDDKGGQG